MLISVIIPTYKPQEYIETCLRSLETQTFEKNQFEVLVVLNGEKEPYYNTIQNRLKTYAFNSRLLYTPIANVSNARNVGLNEAKGEYICFIDDDDYISADYLKELHSIASCSSHIVAVSNVKTFNDNNYLLGDDYISKTFYYFSVHPIDSIFKKRKFLSSSCCKLLPKSVVGQNRFNPKYKIGEDSLFMFSISSRIDQIALSSGSAIYYRRLRVNSASRRKQSVIFRISNRINLIGAYTRVYIRHITQYNFWLFLSRIVATIIPI